MNTAEPRGTNPGLCETDAVTNGKRPERNEVPIVSTPIVAQDMRQAQSPHVSLSDGDIVAQWRQMADMGWYVFPIKRGFKNPGTSFGIKWLREWVRPQHNPIEMLPGFSVGMASMEPGVFGLWLATGQISKVVVFDADSPEAEKWLRNKIGDDLVDRTLKVTTRRGHHFYFYIPADDDRSWASFSDDKIGYDFRADLGGVVLPPSVHESGHVYEWVGGTIQLAPEALHREATPAPASGENRVCPEPEGTKFGLDRLTDLLGQIRELEEGGRNIGVNKFGFMIGQWVGGGELDREYAEAAMLDAVYEVTDDEVDVRSALHGFEDGMMKPLQPTRTDRGDELYRVRLVNGAQVITDLASAINSQAVPDVYRSNGSLTHVFDADSPELSVGETRKSTRTVDAPTLGALMAQHVFMYVEDTTDDGKTVEKRKQPAQATLMQVLRYGNWPGVPQLRRISRIPVIRYDGTILNVPGYDPTSGVYLDPRCDFSQLACDPTPEQVAAARSFLLDKLIVNFPFAQDADRANAVALIATPYMRDFLNGPEGVRPTPFGVIKAPKRGTGKSLLTDVMWKPLGPASVRPWVDEENELRKAVTALLLEQGNPVCVLDNVPSGHAIRSATLSALTTMGMWSDRQLGASKTVTMANDRLWLATGNNPRFGGDNASRSVLSCLDSGMDRPELRTGFAIPDLGSWLDKSENQATVVRCMLTLVRAWIAAGAPQIETPMRGYSWWSSAMAGFLDFHGIPGFLGNSDVVRDMDTDEDRYSTFLAKWYELYPEYDNAMEVGKLCERLIHSTWGDAIMWACDPNKQREVLSSNKLANNLAGMVDSKVDGLVLRAAKPGGPGSKKSKQYWVEKYR